MKNKIIFIIYFISILLLSKSENYTVEQLWEKTLENLKVNVATQYFLSDIDNIFNETQKKKLKYELSLLYADTNTYSYAFIIKNICCGNLNDENFITEYSNFLGNEIYKKFSYSNEKNTIILLLITEPKKYKISLFGSELKKEIKDNDLNYIYKSIKKLLNENDFYNVFIDTSSSLKWIFELIRESKFEDEEDKKKEDEEEKKNKDEEINDNSHKDPINNNNKDNNKINVLIGIIIFLLFAFIILLLICFKMCKKMKILSSKRIDFNPYDTPTQKLI